MMGQDAKEGTEHGKTRNQRGMTRKKTGITEGKEMKVTEETEGIGPGWQWGC